MSMLVLKIVSICLLAAACLMSYRAYRTIKLNLLTKLLHLLLCVEEMERRVDGAVVRVSRPIKTGVGMLGPFVILNIEVEGLPESSSFPQLLKKHEWVAKVKEIRPGSWTVKLRISDLAEYRHFVDYELADIVRKAKGGGA